MTNEKKIKLGEQLADILQLKEADGFYSEKRYKTTWGTKTALGIYETAKRILGGQ